MPEIDLGLRDTTILEYQNFIIGQPPIPGLKYLWNAGDFGHARHPARWPVRLDRDQHRRLHRPATWLRVQVIEKAHIWVPNVFRPDLDGVNEILNVYVDESVRRIRTFQIADRWGELMFRHDNFVPNNYENNGWGGKIREKPATPGVYTWLVEVEFLDGETRRYVGDALLMR